MNKIFNEALFNYIKLPFLILIVVVLVIIITTIVLVVKEIRNENK